MANPHEKKDTTHQKDSHNKEKRNFKTKQSYKQQSAKKAPHKNEEPIANTDKLEKTIEEVVIPEKELIVQRLDHSLITINGDQYEIVKDYREAFDARRLSERYSSILDKYDYIVADWGFEQLRLKGFYDNQNRKVPQDKKISQLEDYLYEYCNFGAPYFVLKRLEAKKSQSNTAKPNRRKKQKRKNITNRKTTHTQDYTEQASTNQTATGNKRGNRPAKKKNFVQKEVTPKEKMIKPEKETVVVKTVKDEKGSRRFNIRRNDVDRAKNKS
ncbi:YutD family protein [Desemzia sp. RIT804]|uniref:YutD family protein n=1 Tax=Desemzia sp. RIT 804 TaxID=2810209 RepID=UPI00194E0B83|nr:YutD family protein [Desemzia sp. RIT 804]MBM6615776.1 YutD family protein [Desemzia sp. RIT 804]